MTGSVYAQAASRMQDDPAYQPFDAAWADAMKMVAHVYMGRSESMLEICAAMADRTGLAGVVGLSSLPFGLTFVGRSGEAMAIAENAINAARAHANPFWIAVAYGGCGVAFAETDPARALDIFRLGLALVRRHRVPLHEAQIARDAAGLEAVHGDLNQALTLFTTSIDSYHRAGDRTNLGATLKRLFIFFSQINRPEIAGDPLRHQHRPPHSKHRTRL